ncbi:hypothetical protein D3C81_1428060 [compost metagenome]
MAEAREDGFLGPVERHHQLAVLPRQGQALAFDVELAQRFEQRRLDLQVVAQFEEQPRQALLHRLVGEQRIPQHRQQSVPGRAGHQQQRLAPQFAGRAALVDADHGVDRQDQGGRGDRRIAFAEGAEQLHGEGRQRQPGGECPGIGEQQLDGEGGEGEAEQGHQQRVEAAEPVVVGLRQGAGDHSEEQRDHQFQVVEEPADGHHPAEGDEHPQAVGELVQRPEAPQGVEQRRGLHVQRGLPDVSRSD